MGKSIIILPTARAIRHELLQITQDDIFLPHYVTMGDFLSKLCIVDGYKFIDDDTRILLLLEASDFKDFAQLHIERNFFTFTKNSSYIFKFFEELSAECYPIEKLKDADIYAEYEEHIAILEELYKRYENLCNEKKLLDKIFIPHKYRFNHSYLNNVEHITLYLSGQLTNFELLLLEEVIHYTQLDIVFQASNFNLKMQNRLKELGFEIEKGHKHLLDFNTKKTKTKIPLMASGDVTCESFSENLLQIAFIKKKIYEFIAKGYKPEKIAVILPNESKAALLKSFDTQYNLNFAMGESFRDTFLYKKFHATLNALDQRTKENSARLKRYGEDLFELLFPLYHQECAAIDVEDLFNRIKILFNDTESLLIYEKEFFKFLKIVPMLQHMRMKAVLNLFLQRMATQTIDDVRGGKITVMGVLETRNISFDGVILIDFDDNSVPKRSEKDMFLNTKVRELAKLPTQKDRENLQKHYYWMLIDNAKEVAISYVKSADSKPSRFLKQLGVHTKNRYKEEAYSKILFPSVLKKELVQQDITLPYSFVNTTLSATQLKTYLSCKRKYYYQYILKLAPHTIEKDMPQEYEIGIHVHNALHRLYQEKPHYSSVDQLQKDLFQLLDSLPLEHEFEHYLIAMQKKLLVPFCHNEIERFNAGWSVAHTEKNITITHKGMRLCGQIDRVDIKDNLVEVLDYKTGSYTLYNAKNVADATDFQLEFYTLLASSFGNVVGQAFYDLKEGIVVPETLVDEKMAILESHLADLMRVEEITFSMCESLQTCRYCPYSYMCHRE